MPSASPTALHRLPPLGVLAFALAFGMAVLVVVTSLAQQRPWLGLRLGPAPEGGGAVVRASGGPAADLPPGTRIVAVEGTDDRLELKSLDLTVEPDGAMGTYFTYREFLDRQDRLARLQASEKISLISAEGRKYSVRPDRDGRPISDLPADFWVQCLVGLVAWIVSVAVYVFRPGEASARYLLLSGASTLIFAPSAAIYTTRELAVPGSLLRWASDLNFFGGSLFAASFVGLLLVYPRRIAPRWAGPAVVALFIGWFVAQQVGVFESMTFARRFLVMLGVLATFVLAAVHWRVSDRDPLARAKLQWFLLSWVVGTSVFALFILLPQTFGVDTSPIQGYAFLLFLLVYGGLSLGILRYRLFELGDWWRRVIGWALVVLLLVLLDLFFLYGLHLSTGASLAVALLVCGIVWVPLRGWLWSRFTSGRERTAPDLFMRVVDVALAPPGEGSGGQRWRDVMDLVFEPLEISVREAAIASEVSIERDGLALSIPPVERLPALTLAYARRGHGLFTPRDVSFATELIAVVRHAFESVASYETGVAEERRRIAREMHDNIGAQLLTALHSVDASIKDLRIRESLTDLRGVINDLSEDSRDLAMIFAELRIETLDRLEAAGLVAKWTSEAPDGLLPSKPLRLAVRSIVREAVSNAIRHAVASEVVVCIRVEEGRLSLTVRDNGKGFVAGVSRRGHGVENMRLRSSELGGSFSCESGRSGTTVEASIPLDQSDPR